MPAPVLISMPHGLNASGVTLFAVRLANGLASRGRACALVVHDEPRGQRAIRTRLHPAVETIDARGLPPLDACDGRLADYLPAYRLACDVLACRAGGPVVCLPAILGDSWGVMAALSRERDVRVLAVHHSDTRYNDAVCARYERLIAAFVGVSDVITGRMRVSLSSRATDIYGVPCGVEVPAAPPVRAPLVSRPLRIVYAGRLDHEQKRVGALPPLSDALSRAGIAHELAVFGDGPAAAELRRASRSRRTMRLYGAVGPERVTGALRGADVFVLPSRYEGLSVSLLEAMAWGAVPVVTPSVSGTAQLVTPGETGLLASAAPEDDEANAGGALAEAIGSLSDPEPSLGRMRAGAWRLVGSRFDVRRSVTRYGAIIDRAAASVRRVWPAHVPAAFTGDGSRGSGTLPAEGGLLMRRLLEGLRGRRVAVWGTGRHTVELRAVLEQAPVEIAAFLDDDASRHGQTLWDVPIVGPGQAVATGATDVVISSWLHEERMWERRPALENAGLRVHRPYAGGVAA